VAIDKIDYSQVDPALIERVMGWEANKPENKQLAALGDLQGVLEHLVITLEQGQTATEGDVKQLGALLTDIRTSLASLDRKEAPDSPDYASPVVRAVKSLETALTAALNAVEVKPTINVEVPKIDAPQVNVAPPSVDLKGVEAVLRDELPQAFQAAIAAIPEAPETDLGPLVAQLQAMSEQLASIETATRLKPQAPTTLKVTNPDGSLAGQPFIDWQWDSVALTQTTLTDVYTFYLGDTVVPANRRKTVTITYTDSGKLTIATVGKVQ
jgi:hypothetical protein